VRGFHDPAKLQMAVFVSVLAHAAGFLALVLMRPNSFPPTGVEAIEVSIVIEAKDASAELSQPLPLSPETPAASRNSVGPDWPLGGASTGRSVDSWTHPDFLRSITPPGFADVRRQSPASQDWTPTFLPGKYLNYLESDATAGALGCPARTNRHDRPSRHIGCVPIDTAPLLGAPPLWTDSMAALHASEPDQTSGGGGYAGTFRDMKSDGRPFTTWDNVLPSDRPPAMRAFRNWLGELFR
jgi:hypothetical protein